MQRYSHAWKIFIITILFYTFMWILESNSECFAQLKIDYNLEKSPYSSMTTRTQKWKYMLKAVCFFAKEVYISSDSWLSILIKIIFQCICPLEYVLQFFLLQCMRTTFLSSWTCRFWNNYHFLILLSKQYKNKIQNYLKISHLELKIYVFNVAILCSLTYINWFSVEHNAKSV